LLLNVLLLVTVGESGVPPRWSTTGEVGVLMSFEPCESFAFFFLRNPNDGMEP
jgi:hypothetical protein